MPDQTVRSIAVTVEQVNGISAIDWPRHPVAIMQDLTFQFMFFIKRYINNLPNIIQE